MSLRWWLTRVDALGRRRGFPVVSVCCLALAGVAFLVPVVRHDRLEDRLTAVSSELVASPVTVRCQSVGAELVDAGAELGYVGFSAAGVPERSTLIKHGPCDDLADYLGSDRSRPTFDQVVAVHVLTHEAMHMAGSTAEAEAECRAVQRNARTARLLGASPDQAAALAARYWREAYPRNRDGYRSAECRPGGALDERLGDAPWTG